MKNIELILSVVGTALPLLAAAVTCLIRLIKCVRAGKEENKKRLWAEFAQEAVRFSELLRGKSGDELTGETKKEIAMTKVEAACVKNGISFEPEAVDEIIENIVDLTKKVNVAR